MIHVAIADAVRDSSVALSLDEEMQIAQDISYAIDSLTAEEVLRDLIDDIGRQRVQQTLNALS
jgi:hypothetical protein